MLEVKTYSIQEIREILGSKTKQSIDGKLKRYDVLFETTGRGEKLIYTIKKFNDPFKVFCITELGFDANSDFRHLRHFFYHFFCDDYFMSMPDEIKEHLMDTAYHYHISRQSIAKYERQLARKYYVSLDGEYFYYFAFHKTQTLTTREKYLKAWHMYWYWIEQGADSRDAMGEVIFTYGGVPRKQHKIEKNAFVLKKIDYILEIIGDSVEKEIENSQIYSEIIGKYSF